jgi:hypothetical protein
MYILIFFHNYHFYFFIFPAPLHTIAYNVSPHNPTPTPSSIPTIALSQNYTSQQQLNNTNLNDYLSQPLVLPNRYANQPRPRPTTNLNGFESNFFLSFD